MGQMFAKTVSVQRRRCMKILLIQSLDKFSVFVRFLWCLWDSFDGYQVELLFFLISSSPPWWPVLQPQSQQETWHSNSSQPTWSLSLPHVLMILYDILYLYIFSLWLCISPRYSIRRLARRNWEWINSLPEIKTSTPCLDLETHSFFDFLCALFIILYPRSLFTLVSLHPGFDLGFARGWVWAKKKIPSTIALRLEGQKPTSSGLQRCGMRDASTEHQEVEFGGVPRICAYLAWGNGWLQQIGFVDFAGSAVVHQANRFVDVVLNCCAESRGLQQ